MNISIKTKKENKKLSDEYFIFGKRKSNLYNLRK